jgi:hypothetical protein
MDSPICLEWWSCRRLRVHANPTTGEAHLRVLPCGHGVSGTAWKTGGAWYLLRAHNGEMVLQVGGHLLRLSDVRNITVRAEGPRRRRVRVVGGGRGIDVSYRSPADRIWSRFDPTFDSLDEELSDFFVRVLRIWQSASRGSELVEMWAATGAGEE